MNKGYKIGDVAQLTGLTARTIRYYEELGLLEESDRSEGGTRYFSDGDIHRLRRITLLKNVGLTLEDIGRILPLYYEDGRALEAKHEVLKILQAHLATADKKIEELKQFREETERNIAVLEQYIRYYDET
ncbi:MerR family transcriptional regulator [Paenibacillus sp. J5C_2022]|uniref:helix-turn-helix domain-containing protein n=1 Tax=Paenibacillus sp. J5C2022 TaxID=2977129 RepID=UPI0021CE6B7D|nr:MerR family transcriptional regulator [Paenibacillus sp. J5C2022]MCU6707443.1 MerR family transcriptional regulator [Paenibacillus sp. J5C2022]